jgi:hypothetical protein
MFPLASKSGTVTKTRHRLGDSERALEGLFQHGGPYGGFENRFPWEGAKLAKFRRLQTNFYGDYACAAILPVGRPTVCLSNAIHNLTMVMT